MRTASEYLDGSDKEQSPTAPLAQEPVHKAPHPFALPVEDNERVPHTAAHSGDAVEEPLGVHGHLALLPLHKLHSVSKEAQQPSALMAAITLSRMVLELA